MRILLLQSPTATETSHACQSPPLGIAYVAQALLDEGHDVEIVDLNVTGLNPSRLAVTLERKRPHLVGISAHTETYPNALRLARIVKEHDVGVPVILGGPHASILPLEVLSEPDIDYVAVGEGEQTAAELVRAIGSGSLPVGLLAIDGLGHKVDGTPTLNAPRQPLDAARIGLPARHLLSLEFYEDSRNILVARGGCPYRCPFCSASYLWGGRRRLRPVEHVLDEVEQVIDDYGPGHVFFVDDILTLNRPWLEELMRGLERFRGLITWGCATRVDRVDEELLGKMADSGCTGIQFGIESGAQEILDSVKGIDKATALAAVEASVANGIATSCSFMIPFPDDTEETLAETSQFMGRLHEAGGRLLISYTTPFPGTKFYEDSAELGLDILTDDYSLYDAKHVVMRTRNLSAERIEEIATEIADGLGMASTTQADHRRVDSRVSVL